MYYTFSSVSIVNFEQVNVSWVKIAQKKKSYCERTLGADFRFRSWAFFKADVLKSFGKITRKQLCHSLFLIKLQTPSKFLQETVSAICLNFQLYLVQLKKLVKMYIFLSHLITWKLQLFLNTEYKVINLKIALWKSALWKKTHS